MGLEEEYLELSTQVCGKTVNYLMADTRERGGYDIVFTDGSILKQSVSEGRFCWSFLEHGERDGE